MHSKSRTLRAWTLMFPSSLLLSSTLAINVYYATAFTSSSSSSASSSSSSSFHHPNHHHHHHHHQRQCSRDRRRRVECIVVARSSVPSSSSLSSDDDLDRFLSSSASSSSSFGGGVGGFEALGLSPSLLRATSAMGWEVPTPVQRLAIPAILGMTLSWSHPTDVDDDDGAVDGGDRVGDGAKKRDALWCEGHTGSGKTGAFALPIIECIMRRMDRHREDLVGKRNARPRRRRKRPTESTTATTALVLCPTRELALQTRDLFVDVVSRLSPDDHGIVVRAVYGGSSITFDCGGIDHQEDVDVLVATPGRLLDVLGGSSSSSRRGRNGRGRGGAVGDNRDDNEDDDDDDPRRMAEFERRILRALDAKSSSTDVDNEDDDDIIDGGRQGGRKRRMDGRAKGGRGGGSRGGESSSSLDVVEIQRLLEGLDDTPDDEDHDDSALAMRRMLSGLQFLVLDEADRLLGKAFEYEMDELVSVISSASSSSSTDRTRRPGLTTMLFSATFPRQIETRIDRVLSRIGGAGVMPPLRLSTTSSASTAPSIRDGEAPSPNADHDVDGDDRDRRRTTRHPHYDDAIAPVTSADDAPKIRHRAIRLNEEDRTRALRYLLESRWKRRDNLDDVGNAVLEDGEYDDDEWDRVLVFVATRHKAEQVSKKLRRNGIQALELHGKLDQSDRDMRLGAFRSGKTRVLIATDLAARGIDVRGLSAVINYDLPRGADDFVHRTGRTGRAGRIGRAISFVTASTESHFDFLEKRVLPSSQKVVREVLDGFAIDEAAWASESAASTTSVPGSTHSRMGLDHDRTFGGVKGRRKSKKDKLREAAAAAAARGS